MAAAAAGGAPGVATGRMCTEGVRRGTGVAEYKTTGKTVEHLTDALFRDTAKHHLVMERLNEMSNVET